MVTFITISVRYLRSVNTVSLIYSPDLQVGYVSLSVAIQVRRCPGNPPAVDMGEIMSYI